MRRSLPFICWTLAAVFTATVLHASLLEILADGVLVAKLLSPGPHSPILELLVAAAFLSVRLGVIVLGPSVVVAAAILACAEWGQRAGTARATSHRATTGLAASEPPR